MKEVLSLGAFVMILLCLAAFVFTLKPDVIGTVQAPNISDCHIGHSSAQECDLNVLAVEPRQQR